MKLTFSSKKLLIFTKGKKEGKKEEKISIAKNMLIKKINIEEISEITGLSIEELKNLK